MAVLLSVQDLSLKFSMRGGLLNRVHSEVSAVSQVNLSLKEGITVGIVGESGCGKTSLGRTLVKLYEPSSGKIYYKGQDLSTFSAKNLRLFRQEVQMIFQDPFASLNPRFSVREILEEPFRLNSTCTTEEKKEKIKFFLKIVGLDESVLEQYPHEFSGGQRQRISIARTLILHPKLIVADEPVSALDVSIQSQILNLLKELQKKLGLTYLFISHDLSVVRYIAKEIAVMYLGKILEYGSVEDLYNNPKHPYTKALLEAIPKPDPNKRGRKNLLQGDIPSPLNPPKGCVFHTRCPLVRKICREKSPLLVKKGNKNIHKVACHLV